MDRMNIVIVGHVDHGKSTVIGRLLADTGSLPEGKLEQVKATCAKNAKPFEYAFLLDALKDEQSQGITIDAAAVSGRGFAAVTDELTEKFGGSASAAADTLAGRVENLGVRWGELKESLGQQLLPVLEGVIDSFDKAEEQTDKFGNPLAGLISLAGDAAGSINNLIFETTGLNDIGD